MEINASKYNTFCQLSCMVRSITIIWGDIYIKVSASLPLNNFSTTAVTAIYWPAIHRLTPCGTEHCKFFSIEHRIISILLQLIFDSWFIPLYILSILYLYDSKMYISGLRIFLPFMMHKIMVSHMTDVTLDLTKHSWFLFTFLPKKQSFSLLHFFLFLILSSFPSCFSSLPTPSGISWVQILSIEVTHKYSATSIFTFEVSYLHFWWLNGNHLILLLLGLKQNLLP